MLRPAVTTISERNHSLPGGSIAQVFDESLLQPIVNKQFAEIFTSPEDGDEVALAPDL